MASDDRASDASKPVFLDADDRPAPFGKRALATIWPESRGIQPIESGERTAPHYLSLFTLWLSASMTIAALSTGTLGPLLYELSFPASCGVIVGVNLLSCSLPALLGLMGPRTGMRQMTLARWAFGYTLVVLPAILNVASMLTYCLLNSIVGGQALVAASRGQNLDIAVGIVIVAVVSLVLSLCGYRALHAFELYAWIPVFIAFCILAGVANSNGGLSNQAEMPPATAGRVLSFIAVIFGWTVSWSPLASDFNTYDCADMRPDVSRVRVFLCTFLGLYLPCALIQMFGAAIYLASTSNASWTAGFEANSIGGLIGAVLLDYGLGNFARFLLVIFALGMICNNAPTIYSFSLNCQVLFPWFVRLPRWVFAFVGTAIYLPLAVVGSSSYTTALSNFLGLVGYWSSIFVSIVLIEHFIIRKRDFSSYRPADFDSPRRLPPGLAAFFACGVGAAGAVLGMDQIWYRGPIATRISDFGGDIGFELALTWSAIAYLPARYLERRFIEPWWLKGDRVEKGVDEA